MRLLVGLGNPGSRYASTRHNFGFEVVDRIAEETGASWSWASRHSLITETQFGGRSVLLAKPQTYMNRSGWAVAELVEDKDLVASQVLVFLDDVALPLGVIRIRERGGDGGHLGLASVLEALGEEEVPRVRLGIRPELEPDDLSEFVLEPFTSEERKVVSGVVDRAVAAARVVMVEGIAKAMSLHNVTSAS